MNLELENKTVLITGASRGIGAATARQFLREGARVILVSRGSQNLKNLTAELKERYGHERVTSEVCDCTIPEVVEDLARKFKEADRELDSVIANVGDGRSVPDPFPSRRQWGVTWDNNFHAAFYTAKLFAPLLRKGSNLTFISSIAGLEAFGAPVDYGTAKAAVVAFAKNISRKLAPDIRVNVVAPGNVLFDGGAWDEKVMSDPERISKLIKTTVPMMRFGTPEEIADAIVFLSSSRASFITGATLVVDGGQTVAVG